MHGDIGDLRKKVQGPFVLLSDVANLSRSCHVNDDACQKTVMGLELEFGRVCRVSWPQ